MHSLQKIYPYVFIGSLFFAVAGAYLGNWAISIAHGGVILSFFLGSIGYIGNRGDRRDRSFRVPLSLWCLILLVVIGVVSIIVNWESYDRPFKDLKKLRYLLIPVGLFLFPWCRSFLISNSRFLITNGIKILVGVVVVVTAASFVGLLTGFHPLTFGPPSYADRISGVFGLSLSFANSLSLTFLLLVGLLISAKTGRITLSRKVILFLSGVSVLLGLGVYYAMSRGAILALFCGICSMALGIRSRLMWGAVILGVIFVLGLSLSTNNMFVEKFKIGVDSVRLAQWRAAGITFLDHPTIGVGFRQFEKQCGDLKKRYGLPPDKPVYKQHANGEYYVSSYTTMNSHAHNNYIEAFASTGILGGCVFLAFIGFWIREVGRDELVKVIFYPVIIAFAVSGFFENTFTDSEVLHWIIMIYVTSQLLLLVADSSARKEIG